MYQMSVPLGQTLQSGDKTSYQTPPIPSSDESRLLRIKDRLGFVLRKQRSAIPHPDAGYGCFVDGEVRKGQVFSIYPGIVYLPLHLKHMKGFPHIDNENANLLARYDNSIIDAKDGGGIDKEDVLEHTNPLALGHYINRPPPGAWLCVCVLCAVCCVLVCLCSLVLIASAGTKPNCMPYYYDFPIDFPVEFHPYVPNVYHLPPPWIYRMMGDNKTLMRRYTTSPLVRVYYVCRCVCCDLSLFFYLYGSLDVVCDAQRGVRGVA